MNRSELTLMNIIALRQIIDESGNKIQAVKDIQNVLDCGLIEAYESYNWLIQNVN